MNKFYHVTTENWGESIELHPTHGRRDYVQDTRDTISCICVSPTPEQALLSRGGYNLGSFNVYCTAGIPKPAEWVEDYWITKEHRFYTKCRFEHVRTLKSSFKMYSSIAELNKLNLSMGEQLLKHLEFIKEFVKWAKHKKCVSNV